MADQLVRNGYESGLDEATRRAIFDLRRRIDAVDVATLETRVAALEAKVTPTPWTNLTLDNGFTNFGSYQTCQYRLVGDVVQLRGLMLHSASFTVPLTIATLPVGFRPPTLPMLFSTFAATASYAGAARLDVKPTGDITYNVHPQGAGASASVSYVTLDGIYFSVTP